MKEFSSTFSLNMDSQMYMIEVLNNITISSYLQAELFRELCCIRKTSPSIDRLLFA